MRFTSSTSLRRPRMALRALRLATVALGVGLAIAPQFAHAADDDDDETFEEGIIRNIMQGLGGTNMENTGIEYRERSPLVVPPKIDLPPPTAANTEVNVANWPKDPDVARRKAAREANRKKANPDDAKRPLTPNELNAHRTAPQQATVDSNRPGESLNNPVLSPSQLGFSGWNVGNLFRGNVAETAPFTGEPMRGSLTQPPVGYQTPSSAFAYGTGPKESLNREYNPAAGKY